MKVEENTKIMNRFVNYNQYRNPLNRIYQAEHPGGLPSNQANTITNADISNHFGQANIEKSYILIVIILLYEVFWLFYYLEFLTQVFKVVVYVSIGLDLAVASFLTTFYFKLKQERLLTRISSRIRNACDAVVAIDSITKVYLFVGLQLQAVPVFSAAYCFFLVKFLLEVYFCTVSMKCCLFFPCSYRVIETFKVYWGLFLYYVFCIEDEDNLQYHSLENVDLEDIESMYV